MDARLNGLYGSPRWGGMTRLEQRAGLYDIYRYQVWDQERIVGDHQRPAAEVCYSVIMLRCEHFEGLATIIDFNYTTSKRGKTKSSVR